MSFSKFEPGCSRHPKLLAAGPLASWFWFCAIDHCSTHLTDGVLGVTSAKDVAPSLSAQQRAAAIKVLVKVGLLEVIDGGWMVHDYLKHNDSKSQVEADRASARTRWHRWKQSQHTNAAANAVATPLANALATPLLTDLSFTPSYSSKNNLVSGSPPRGDAAPSPAAPEGAPSPRPSGPVTETSGLAYLASAPRQLTREEQLEALAKLTGTPVDELRAAAAKLRKPS